MTILPARRLEQRAPALTKKGRLQMGADADITIFDPATVADQSTIDNPAQMAKGIEYVLVMGQLVKEGDTRAPRRAARAADQGPGGLSRRADPTGSRSAAPGGGCRVRRRRSGWWPARPGCRPRRADAAGP